MIRVTVFVDSGKYAGIEMSGHAGYAEHPADGQELVCSAASALAINMANSVEHFTDDPFEADMDGESGYFRFRFRSSDVSPKARLLVDSLIFGLEDIEESYGEPYIKIRFEEV